MGIHRYLKVIAGGIMMVALFSASTYAAYVVSYWDDQVLDAIEEHIEQHVEHKDKETLVYMYAYFEERKRELSDDLQAQYVLQETLEIIDNAFLRILDQQDVEQTERVLPPILNKSDLGEDDEENYGKKGSSGSTKVSSISEEDMRRFMSDDERDQHVVEEEEEEFILYVPNTGTVYHHEEFYDQYWEYVMTKDEAIPDACVLYFEPIDIVAKANDFPTELIIATRWREHSCNLDNPSNGWGNFQITSSRHSPGEITLGELIHQIEEFIEFSKEKREYYDLVQTYGEEPIDISYDEYSLSSIRKHSIFYNGVYPDVTLDNSRYTNDNFSTMGRERDGIVTAMLKILHWKSTERDQ